MEQQDAGMEQLAEENRVLCAQLSSLKGINLGLTSQEGLAQIPEDAQDDKGDDIVIENSIGLSNEQITIEFLTQQNEAQLRRIKALENKKLNLGANDDLLHQITIQNQKIAKLTETSDKMHAQKTQHI